METAIIKNNAAPAEKHPAGAQNGSKILRVIYSAGFIFAVHTAFLAYINSSFLSGFAGKHYIGLIFTAGAALSIYSLNKMPTLLSRFGNVKSALGLMFLEIAALLGLAFLKIAWLIIPLFVIHYALLILLKFNFDIFIEHFSSDRCTGGIRGAYLSITSLAWVVSPIIVGAILTDSDFWKVYLVSALLLLPVMLIIYFNLRCVRDARYETPAFWQTFKSVWRNENIRKVFSVNFLLQFFFSWMVIYAPIYLNQYLGFEWGKIGIIFTIMLLPYALFEMPLGKLADKWFGEKEFLIAGIIITAVSTGMIPFVTSANWMIWAGLLFLTRVGASFIEITTESYFFKQIDDSNANIIGFFRNTRPFAYIVSPLIATILLSFLAYKYLFLVLAVVMLLGLYYSITLRDTK